MSYDNQGDGLDCVWSVSHVTVRCGAVLALSKPLGAAGTSKLATDELVAGRIGFVV